MKVLVYHGTKDVRIDDKPKSKIKDKEDIILRFTSTALWVGLIPLSWNGTS